MWVPHRGFVTEASPSRSPNWGTSVHPEGHTTAFRGPMVRELFLLGAFEPGLKHMRGPHCTALWAFEPRTRGLGGQPWGWSRGQSWGGNAYLGRRLER